MRGGELVENIFINLGLAGAALYLLDRYLNKFFEYIKSSKHNEQEEKQAVREMFQSTAKSINELEHKFTQISEFKQTILDLYNNIRKHMQSMDEKLSLIGERTKNCSKTGITQEEIDAIVNAYKTTRSGT